MTSAPLHQQVVSATAAGFEVNRRRCNSRVVPVATIAIKAERLNRLGRIRIEPAGNVDLGIQPSKPDCQVGIAPREADLLWRQVPAKDNSVDIAEIYNFDNAVNA